MQHGRNGCARGRGCSAGFDRKCALQLSSTAVRRDGVRTASGLARDGLQNGSHHLAICVVNQFRGHDIPFGFVRCEC
eukprot:4199499-Pleurochrysis_carterae.AAC.1